MPSNNILEEGFEQRDGCIQAANGHVWNSMHIIPSSENNIGRIAPL